MTETVKQVLGQVLSNLAVACGYAREIEKLVVEQYGRPLSERQLEDARLAGVKQPEKIRLAPSFECLDQDKRFREIKERLVQGGVIGGITVNYAIILNPEFADNRWVLLHECGHVAQYERLGLEGFLKRYFEEALQYGYRQMPMEVEAEATVKEAFSVICREEKIGKRCEQKAIDALLKRESGYVFIPYKEGVAIVGCDEAFSGELQIPEILGGSRVVALDWMAFHSCKEMTRVTIPASVAEIGDSAFAGCRCLARVEFCGDTPDVAMNAFDGCPDATVYYRKTAHGWGAVLGGIRTVPVDDGSRVERE